MAFLYLCTDESKDLSRHFEKIEALCFLVNGNVGNFQKCKVSIMVLRVSRGLLSPFLYFRFPTTSINDVAYQATLLFLFDGVINYN